MADELVHLDIAGPVATVTLDSPHNRNALSAQLRGELLAHLQTALGEGSVRVIVLAHTGTVFCAGMDLREAREGNLAGDEFPQILELIWSSPKPTVARLAGPARAGGLGMVAACDIAVAADEITFALTEVRIGVIPALISVTLLPRMLPRAANELFLTGETFDAHRAVAIGLINSVVPAAGLDAEIERYTSMLAKGGPRALAGAKELLRMDRAASMADDLAQMSALSASYFSSEEGKEGMSAFLEKRPPSWITTD
jgi:methylglutaconyl-CoA hydratase